MANTSFSLIHTLVFFQILISCNNKTEPAQTDNDTARKEVEETMRRVFTYSSKTNLDSVFAAFDSSEEFKAMAEGIVYTYQQYKQSAVDEYKSLKRLTFQMKSEDISVLSKDLVNYLYSGSVEMINKDSSVTRYQNYAASFLLKKTGSQWKVIFSHESFALPAP